MVKRYTVAEFAELHGWSPESVRQMCRRQLDQRVGKRAELPRGWKAEKIGRDWLISRSGDNSVIARGVPTSAVSAVCHALEKTSGKNAISMELKLGRGDWDVSIYGIPVDSVEIIRNLLKTTRRD